MLHLIEKNSWLHDYQQWSGDNECPKKYHVFVGLVVLASILSRRIYFPRMDEVYPNLYVIFVSAPGTGKSTASNIGEKLLRHLNPGVRPRIKNGKVTPEAFRNWLTRPDSAVVPGHPSLDGAIGTVFADELSVFLGKQKYNDGMVELLTKLYDCPKDYEDETVKNGVMKLKNVCITLVGTTVDDALIKSVNESAILGGFVSRVLWICGMDEGRRITFPRPLSETKAAHLLNHLVSLTNLFGEIALDDEAKVYYDDWYTHHPKTHPVVGGFYERMPTHVLKLATLLMASDYARKGKFLRKRYIENAVAILRAMEGDVMTVVTAIKTGVAGSRVDQLYKQMKIHGVMTHAEVVDFLYRNVRALYEIEQTLEILAARGLIENAGIPGTTAYRVKK